MEGRIPRAQADETIWPRRDAQFGVGQKQRPGALRGACLRPVHGADVEGRSLQMVGFSHHPDRLERGALLCRRRGKCKRRRANFAAGTELGRQRMVGKVLLLPPWKQRHCDRRRL